MILCRTLCYDGLSRLGTSEEEEGSHLDRLNGVVRLNAPAMSLMALLWTTSTSRVRGIYGITEDGNTRSVYSKAMELT